VFARNLLHLGFWYTGEHTHTHTHTLSLSLSLCVGLLGDVLAKRAALVVVLGCLGRGRGSGERGAGSIDVVMAETDP
jgi:hypothetical protein